MNYIKEVAKRNKEFFWYGVAVGVAISGGIVLMLAIANIIL